MIPFKQILNRSDDEGSGGNIYDTFMDNDYVETVSPDDEDDDLDIIESEDEEDE